MEGLPCESSPSGLSLCLQRKVGQWDDSFQLLPNLKQRGQIKF